MDKAKIIDRFHYVFDTSDSDPTDSRSNNFNIIRVIAAFLVILGHMYFIMGLGNQLPVFAGQGIQAIGAKTLFVLCGYFITTSWIKDQHVGRYAVKRLFRIYPAFIVLVLLSVFVLGPIVTEIPRDQYFANIHTWEYFKNLLLHPVYALPGVFTSLPYANVVNGSLWTIPLELAFYVLIPLMTIVPWKKKFPIVGIVLLVLFTAFTFVREFVLFPKGINLVFWGNGLIQATDLIPPFLLGHIFSFVDKKYFNWQIGTIAFLTVSFLNVPLPYSDLVFPLALAYFILSLGNAKNPVFRNWFKKSDFSYGLYLYGFPIQQVMYILLRKANLHPILMTFICFVIVLGFAILSWYFVEKPANKLCKKILSYIPKRKKEDAAEPAA